jgi:hypothetical protein
MSWLSSGLAKIGVSKSVQQSLTKPVLLAAAPFTGGASAALIPLIKKPNPGAPPAAVAVTYAQSTPPDQAGAILQGFKAILDSRQPTGPVVAQEKGFWDRYKVPIMLGGTGFALAGIAIFAMRRR